MDKALIITIILIVTIFISTLYFGTVALKTKIAADLVLDMTKSGYEQKIIDNKVLWVKREDERLKK